MNHRRHQSLRQVALAVGILVVVGGSVTAFFVVQDAKEQEALLHDKEQELAQQKEAIETQKRQFEAQQAKIAELEERLSRAADPSEIERLRRELKEQAVKAAQIRSRAGTSDRKPAAKPEECGWGDIMCNNL
jgi:predicted RNase H-like nuclease (RuvC/YqgF family)